MRRPRLPVIIPGAGFASALLATMLLSACGGPSSSGTPASATYTIGGTLSGLTASSVVLQDDGGDALTLQGNGAFTFSQPIDSGATYAVSVATQPTGQTCAVSGGSGTASANVTSIAVTCTPTSPARTYTIGGTLSGLTSSSVVLENNNGDPLTLQSNGAFTFSQAADSGAIYAVTVATQPTGQTCTVGGGSGTATANVTSVAVTCSASINATFSIGGTLSGLTASSVVLQDNGGDALTLHGNGAFTFSQSIANGATYAVSVATQPDGEICTVSDGSGTATAMVTNVLVSCTSFAGSSNAVTMTVEPGPASPGDQPFNQPLVTVKICTANNSSCGTITNVLVDTGSYGLRVMASVLQSAGVTLPAMADPVTAGNTIQECLPFADGYAWGQVSLANVSIGGETSSGTVPIQVINDSATPTPAAPSDCTSNGDSLNSVNELGANGILGVGVFAQDCGSQCTVPNTYDLYFTCVTTTGVCTSTAESLADQITNPTVAFPTDNNGVILQLPAISSAGAPTASGYLVFGIGTESNNALGNAAVLTADDKGNFTTQFDSQSLASSFIDSGSNALYFNDSSLALCGSSSPENEFYCPSITTTLSATNQGQGGTTSTVSFSIANLNDISGSNFAIDDTGGPASPITGFGPYFDWGVPFFYGRTVYFAVAGASAGSATGPYYAY